jgi:hypothetical protein
MPAGIYVVFETKRESRKRFSRQKGSGSGISDLVESTVVKTASPGLGL